MGGGQFLFTNIDGAKTFFKKKFRVGKKSSKKVEEAKKILMEGQNNTPYHK